MAKKYLRGSRRSCNIIIAGKAADQEDAKADNFFKMIIENDNDFNFGLFN